MLFFFLDWKTVVDDTAPETEIVHINFQDQAPARKLSVESLSSTPSPTSRWVYQDWLT